MITIGLNTKPQYGSYSVHARLGTKTASNRTLRWNATSCQYTGIDNFVVGDPYYNVDFTTTGYVQLLGYSTTYAVLPSGTDFFGVTSDILLFINTTAETANDADANPELFSGISATTGPAHIYIPTVAAGCIN